MNNQNNDSDSQDDSEDEDPEKHFKKSRYAKLSSPEHDKNLAVCMDNGNKYLQGMMWKDPDKCELRNCLAGGVISVIACPRIVNDKNNLPQGCHVVTQDCDKEFPDCCEYVHCPLKTNDEKTMGIGLF